MNGGVEVVCLLLLVPMRKEQHATRDLGCCNWLAGIEECHRPQTSAPTTNNHKESMAWLIDGYRPGVLCK